MKMDMRSGMWNVRSLYRAGLFMTAVKEISKYKSDLVEVIWDRDGSEPAGKYTFSMKMGMRIMN
jgi:hypothetical protein